MHLGVSTKTGQERLDGFNQIFGKPEFALLRPRLTRTVQCGSGRRCGLGWGGTLEHHAKISGKKRHEQFNHSCQSPSLQKK